jgi:hypothetical protein
MKGDDMIINVTRVEGQQVKICIAVDEKIDILLDALRRTVRLIEEIHIGTSCPVAPVQHAESSAAAFRAGSETGIQPSPTK